MKKWLLKWTLGWAAVGFAVAAMLSICYWLFDLGLGAMAIVLWPSSIGLMGLEGPTPRTKLDIAEFYIILIALNMVTYALVGLITAPIAFLAKRRSTVA